MPSSVNKVTKSLRRKNKDLHSLHAESRSAKKLRRAVGRDEKLIKQAALRDRVNEPLLDRVRYFQNAIVSSPEIAKLDSDGLRKLAEESVAMYEPELKELKAARRPGRPASAREDWLKNRTENDRREFDVGYWVPDLTDEANVDRLRLWDGDWSMLSPIKFVRIDTNGTMKESRWPPNGMS